MANSSNDCSAQAGESYGRRHGKLQEGSYLMDRPVPVHGTFSQAYKKNDRSHVEQRNFTHVRPLLDYGRHGDIRLVELVNDLCGTVWLPLRNHNTPVIKLVERTRSGSKVTKKCGEALAPWDRLLGYTPCSSASQSKLRAERKHLDPLELPEQIDEKLAVIFEILSWLKEAEVTADLPSKAIDGSVCLVKVARKKPKPSKSGCHEIPHNDRTSPGASFTGTTRPPCASHQNPPGPLPRPFSGW
ncbi:hypothetical protein ACFQY0_14055 [Haloferula chungangensis]|uniref:Uncharacterized protein n=1 Tax=Haloferula chungangensis TaxID=1048331 RepID=A0ABW2LAH7_9BACT